MSQFSLVISAGDGPAEPATLERFAQELRVELGDAEAARVEQFAVGTPPEGAKGLEVLAVIGFFITIVQAGESAAKVVRAIRRVATRYAHLGQRLKVTIDGVSEDLADADNATVEQVIEQLRSLPAQSQGGARHALVITNGTYDDARLTQLRSPAHDGQELARVLGDPAIGGFQVELLADADENSIRRRLSSFFANRNRDDLLLVHFSCHGVKDSLGRLYLAARDTDMSDLRATGLRAGYVNELLAETDSKRVVLILDCCYSGAFARGVVPRSGDQVNIADEFGQGTGRIVLTASSATEYAFESGTLTRSDATPSAFTSALVEGLETGAADLDADGDITVDELYEFIHRRVRESTPGQAPMRWIFGEEGRTVVARSPRPATLPQEILDDMAHERIALRLEAVRSLARLLGSDRPGLRAAALAALVGMGDTDDSARVRQAAAGTLTKDGPPNAETGSFRRPPKKAAETVAPSNAVLVRKAAAPPHVAVPAQVAAPPAEVTDPVQAAIPTAEVTEPAQAVVSQAKVPDPVQSAAPLAQVAERTASAVPPWKARFGGWRQQFERKTAHPKLLIVAAILAIAGILLTARLNLEYLSVDDGLLYTVAWMVELGAALLVLVTRTIGWAAVLVGLLGRHLLLLGVYGHEGFEDVSQDHQTDYLFGVVIALAALCCGAIALMRERFPARRVVWAQGALALVVLPLSFVIGQLIVDLLLTAFNLDLDNGLTIRTVACVLFAAIVPLFGILAAGNPATKWLLIGWTGTSALTALWVVADLFANWMSDENLERLVLLGVLLPITAAVAFVLIRVQRPRAEREEIELLPSNG